MATDLKKRKRKIDLNKLNEKQADNLGKQIGDKIALIMDEANSKCNELLGIYNLQTSRGYEITEIKKEELK